MRKVAIVGAGTLPWRSRYIDKTARALALEATQEALKDARVGKELVDGVVYSIASETALRQQIPTDLFQDYIGLQDKPSTRVEGDAATGICSLFSAFAQIASGMSDVLLLLGIQKGQDLYSSETMSRGDGFLKGSAMFLDTSWLYHVCPGCPAYLTGVVWLPRMQKYGGPTPEQAAKVSVKNHRNALTNPEAQLKLNVTVQDVLNSRIIAWPTTMLECCLYSDYAAALILASEEKAKEICDNPVWISGISVSNFASNRFVPETLGRMMGVNTAAKKAYEMAGVKEPSKELDVLEVHDLISAVEILTCEELGLCELGEGGRLVDEGVFDKSGSLPVNPSGGRVACGHVGGVSDVYSVAQVVRQLQERAGGTQVPIRHGKGLVEAIDAFGGLAGVAILER